MYTNQAFNHQTSTKPMLLFCSPDYQNSMLVFRFDFEINFENYC